MKKIIRLLIPAFIIVLCLAGCGSTDRSKAEINVGIGASPNTFDPQLIADSASSEAAAYFMAGLYQYNVNKELVPCLAESYDLSPDRLTYTFHLKKGLKWSDGRPLNAEDFAFGLQRLADPDVGSNAIYLITECCTIKNAEAVSERKMPVGELGVSSPDDTTLIIELERPCPFFCDLLTMPSFAPCNKDFYHSVGKDYADSAENILSCGPYMVDRYEPLATQIHYSRNPYYVDADKIKPEGINLRVVTDTQQALMSYKTGILDIIRISGQYTELATGDPELHAFSTATTKYLEVNHRTCPALQNKNVLRAICKSINREDLTTKLLKEGNYPLTRFVPPGSCIEPDKKDFAEDKDRYASQLGYDQEEAKKLWEKGLSELGKDSLTIELAYDSGVKDLMEAVKSEVEANLKGLTLELKSITFKDRLQKKNAGDYELLFSGWNGDYADPTTFLGQFLSEAAPAGYNNPDFDKLYNECQTAKLAQDPPARYKQLHALEDMLAEDVGYIPLYTSGELYLIRKGVEGFIKTPTGGAPIVTGLTKEVR